MPSEQEIAGLKQEVTREGGISKPILANVKYSKSKKIAMVLVLRYYRLNLLPIYHSLGECLCILVMNARR